MLDLQEYVVTKKWVVITEISKEVENNNIGRLNSYSRRYVSRGLRVGDSGDQLKQVTLMVVLEDHIQEVVVLDVLDPLSLYTHSCLLK
jgi:hypothetical protein